MQTDILDTLFGARDTVTSLIITLTPADPAQVQQLGTLMQRRDRLTAAIQQVIDTEFTRGSAELDKAVADLEATTAQLAAVKKTLDGVTVAIGVVDQLIQIVTAIVGLAG